MMDRKAFLAKIQPWIDSHAEEMIEEVQRFCRIRSVSRADLAEENAPFGRECADMLDFATGRAEHYGFKTEIHAYHCASAILGDGENAIGVISHMDVVPEGDKWIYPPYEATRVGDFLIGRGVSDNKSPGVMTLFIMRMFRELGIELKHGVRLIFGSSEETGMQDMDYFTKHVTQPVVTLVPDAGFPVNYAQKGSMSGRMRIAIGDQIAEFSGGEVDNMVPPHATALLKGVTAAALQAAFAAQGISAEDLAVSEEDGGVRVKARGVAAHAASPDKGKSAIHLLADALAKSGLFAGQDQKALEGIADMSSDCFGGKAGIACEDPDTGKTTMNIGVAATENGTVRLHLDCRLSVAADIEDNVAAFKAYASGLGFDPYQVSTTNPVFMPKEDPRVQALMGIYAEVTGDTETQPYSMGGGTYSRCLENAITFGPGFPNSEARPDDLPEGHGGAHAPDEYLYIPNLLRAMPIYACAIAELDEIV